MRRFRHPLTHLLTALALTTPLMSPGRMTAQQAHTSAALDVAGMDRSVKPGDNFFEYANGTWLKRRRSRPTAAPTAAAPS